MEEMPRPAAFSRRRAITLVAMLLAVGACSSGPSVRTGTDPLPTTSATVTTPPPIAGGRSCGNPSPTVAGQHGLEIQGRMREGQSFFLLVNGAADLAAGKDYTTYARINGAGALKITMVGPSDRIVHATGVRPGVPPYTWGQPGEPWTATLAFPQPGCWRIYVQRGSLDGEAWVQVG